MNLDDDLIHREIPEAVEAGAKDGRDWFNNPPTKWWRRA